MQEEILYIHHMFTPRDIIMVRNGLEGLGLEVKELELGTAAYFNAGNVTLQELNRVLESMGYLVLSKKDKLFIEQVKSLLEEYLNSPYQHLKSPLLSVFLEQKMEMVYDTISRRFSKIERRSLENYFRGLKAAKVKSLLQETDLSIEEIALFLKYRNSRSLGRMFKETTGISIDDFKNGDRPFYLPESGA